MHKILIWLKDNVDLDRLSEDLSERTTKGGFPIQATDWRERVAYGASRGLRALTNTSTIRAIDSIHACACASFLSPRRGSAPLVAVTHGSPRGLFSVAAPRLLFAGFIALFSLAWLPPAQAAVHKTQNVFLIISDGFRWKEVFNGAEADLMTKQNGGVQN